MKLMINRALFEHFVPAFENADDAIFERMNAFLKKGEDAAGALLGDKGGDFLAEFPPVEMQLKEFVCKFAAYAAIPQLDLVLTETGFGVVSNNNVAPASKERVAALRESLRQEMSLAYDMAVQMLVEHTSWGNSEAAQRTIDKLFYCPRCFNGRFRWKGKDVYGGEFQELQPVLLQAEIKVMDLISQELYNELLHRIRIHKNQAAYEIVRSRAENYIIAFLGGQSMADFKRILVDTVEALSDSLPEYVNSSVFRARHTNGYENKKSDPVFFMS